MTETLKHAVAHARTQVVRGKETVLSSTGVGRAAANTEAEAGLESESVKIISCSRTETAGHHCCCWEGREDPGRTAARLGWSAQEEAL